MNKKMLLVASILCLGVVFNAQAEETVTEKIETQGNKTADAVKKTYRSAKDKTCEMVNGKMECAAKKLKHTGQNAMDKVETKSTEVKNEVSK